MEPRPYIMHAGISGQIKLSTICYFNNPRLWTSFKVTRHRPNDNWSKQI